MKKFIMLGAMVLLTASSVLATVIPCGFAKPCGIAEGKNYMGQPVTYVADTYNNRIVFVDMYGTGSFGSYGGGASQFNTPFGICTSSTTGDVYVADTCNSRIQRFTSIGGFIQSFGQSGNGVWEFNFPYALTVDDTNKYLWVADTRNNRICRYTLDGKPCGMWGSYGSGPCQFNNPAGISCGPNGDVYVSDGYNNRIQVLDMNGNFKSQFPTDGAPAGIAYHSAISSLDSDKLWVSNASNNSVEGYSLAGMLLYKAGGFSWNFGICDSYGGYFLVTDTMNNRIMAQWGSSGDYIIWAQ